MKIFFPYPGFFFCCYLMTFNHLLRIVKEIRKVPKEPALGIGLWTYIKAMGLNIALHIALYFMCNFTRV